MASSRMKDLAARGERFDRKEACDEAARLRRRRVIYVDGPPCDRPDCLIPGPVAAGAPPLPGSHCPACGRRW